MCNIINTNSDLRRNENKSHLGSNHLSGCKHPKGRMVAGAVTNGKNVTLKETLTESHKTAISSFSCKKLKDSFTNEA